MSSEGVMTADETRAVARHRPVPTWLIWLVCSLLFGVYQGLNSLIGAGSGTAGWKPFIWELSSVITVLALMPAVVRFAQRVPVDSKPRRRVVLAHVVGVLVFSAAHTSGMVVLRDLAYA